MEMRNIFKKNFVIFYMQENLCDLRGRQIYADCVIKNVGLFAQVMWNYFNFSYNYYYLNVEVKYFIILLIKLNYDQLTKDFRLDTLIFYSSKYW